MYIGALNRLETCVFDIFDLKLTDLSISFINHLKNILKNKYTEKTLNEK